MNRHAMRSLLTGLAFLSTGVFPVAYASCANPGRLPVDVRDCGAQAGDLVTTPTPPDPDAATTNANRASANTSAINSAFAAGDTILIPPGIWLVNGFQVPAGKTVVTGGLTTVIKKVDVTVETPIVTVTGSNVRVDSFTGDGQSLSVAMPEENMHALAIMNTAPGASAITNVTLGDITGNNIAGDVVYISGMASGAVVSGVTFGTITGSNVYRSIMSIVGGTNISGIAVIGGNCGYTTLDIEPNWYNQAPDLVSIGLVQGGKVQLAAGDGAQPVGAVRLGTVILDSNLQTNSSYPNQRFDLDIGIMASHWTDLRISSLHASNKRWSAFFSPAWGGYGALEIDNYVGSGIGAGNQTYGEFECDGCSELKIGSGSTQLHVGKALFTGATTTVYDIENFTLSGGLGGYVTGGLFRNLTIDASGVAYVMSAVHDTVFQNIQLTHPSSGSTPVFFWSSTDNVLVDSTLDATLQAGSSGNNTLVRTVTQ